MGVPAPPPHATGSGARTHRGARSAVSPSASASNMPAGARAFHLRKNEPPPVVRMRAPWEMHPPATGSAERRSPCVPSARSTAARTSGGTVTGPSGVGFPALGSAPGQAARSCRRSASQERCTIS